MKFLPKTRQLIIRIAAISIIGTGLYLQTGCIYVVNPPADQTQAAQPPVATSDDSQPAPVEQYQPPPPDVVTVYDDDLDSYGTWVTVGGYGRCWSPANRPAGWQPYTVGHWEYTDCGWTWVSEEDEVAWGPICYHYGRWYQDVSYGWVWIPGTTWGPAWVAWREGDGYCGWAPLPPQAGFGPTVSVAVVDQYVPPQRFVYCHEQYVNSPRVYQHFVHNDVTVINQTTNITNITIVNNTVINRGVSITNVQRATGRPVQKVELAQATTAQQARSIAASGKPVVFAPPVVKQAEQQRAQERAQQARGQQNNPQNPGQRDQHSASAQPVHVNQPPPNTPQNPPSHQDQQNPGDQQRRADEQKRKEQQDEAQRQQQAQKQQEEQQKQQQEKAAAQKTQEQKQHQQQDQQQKAQQQQQKEQQQADQQKQQQNNQQQQQQPRQQPKQPPPPPAKKPPQSSGDNSN